ncbi:MAG: hypothetical protein ACXVH2_00830 [Methanobacterium sp.]
MKFKQGQWYKTSDGYSVEFITPIEKDGMYNVFRHNEYHDFKPYHTDKDGNTGYGTNIICELNK